jgi:hypothetical protein
VLIYRAKDVQLFGFTRRGHPQGARQAIGVTLLFRHPNKPGIDHLCVRRHDALTEIPWSDLQRIKDRLAPDGPDRWAVEVFPPIGALIDNRNLRHVWVMPVGWVPPVDLHEVWV